MCATALLVTGCVAPAAPDDASDRRLHVAATFTVLAGIAETVGGEDVRVTSVVRPGAEIHGYEPSPDDLRRAEGAALLLVNGLGLEDWVVRLVDPLGLEAVVVTEDVEPVLVPGTDVVDPHAWMSPAEGRSYVEAVRVALSEADPERADRYAARAAEAQAALSELAEDARRRFAEIPPHRRVLVTCEGAFTYLARDTGLDTASLWPVNAERQGTPRQVAALVDTVRERQVPTVFCESTVSPTAMDQVAAETGAAVGGTLHVDSLTDSDGAAPTYLALLEHTVDTVVAGLADPADPAHRADTSGAAGPGPTP